MRISIDSLTHALTASLRSLANIAAWTSLTLMIRPVSAVEMLDAARLEKYVDALPNPLDNVIAPVNITGGIPSYEISIGQFRQKLHRDLEPTTLWGYNGSYPGPTFNVDRGQEIRVEWTNNLVDAQGRPLDHFLPYDNT